MADQTGPGSGDISRLRQEIARVDADLVALVGRRMRLAEQIGQCKREAGLPIRDFRAEVDVLRRAREACLSAGVDPEMGASFMQVLIEGAVHAQHERSSEGQGGCGGPRRVLVVGGGGRMGTWLCQFFASQGHEVVVHDPAGGPEGFQPVATLEDGVAGADVVALSTPLGETARVLDEVTQAGARGLVFDICSLKAPVAASIERARAAGLRVASVHPLFAPGTALLSGRVLVACDCGHASATQEARALFEDTALRIVDLTLEEHDRLMAWVLCLSHALNISFARALSTSALSVHDLDQVASTTFSRQMLTTREVARENPRLYHEIQHHNPHFQDVLGALVAAVEDLRKAARSPRSEAFEHLMAENRAWFEGTPTAAPSSS